MESNNSTTKRFDIPDNVKSWLIDVCKERPLAFLSSLPKDLLIEIIAQLGKSYVKTMVDGQLVIVDQKDNETVDRILYFQGYRLKICPCGILCGFEHSLHRDFLMIYCKLCSKPVCDNCLIEVENKVIHQKCVS